MPFLVGELKSHMPHNMAKKKKKVIRVADTERLLLNQERLPGFLASGGEEFNMGPKTRLDHSELLCNKVLLKCERIRESF